MPSDVTEAADWTPERIEALRAQVRDIQAAEKLSGADLARETGVSYQTLAAWLAGKYAGRNDRVAVDVARWLGARDARARTRAIAPVAPGFIQTATAEQFIAVLEHTQHTPDMAMITGAAGVGKTSACIRYRDANPNVRYIECEPCFSTPRAVLQELARQLSLYEQGSTASLSRQIVDRLRGTGSLIIVDEAQHLERDALEQVRSLHDRAAIGVALVGNEVVAGRVEGGARTPQFAQLFSRIGMRANRKAPLKRDIEMMLDAWQVEDKPAREMLAAKARMPGALRGMVKCIRLAHMLAGAEGTTLGAAQVEAAWSRLTGGRDG